MLPPLHAQHTRQMASYIYTKTAHFSTNKCVHNLMASIMDMHSAAASSEALRIFQCIQRATFEMLGIGPGNEARHTASSCMERNVSSAKLRAFPVIRML